MPQVMSQDGAGPGGRNYVCPREVHRPREGSPPSSTCMSSRVCVCVCACLCHVCVCVCACMCVHVYVLIVHVYFCVVCTVVFVF